MTKETKSNLIFLAIIVALLLPAAIILVLEQMSPAARRADLFDVVPKTVTYMDPQPTPPGMRRVAPPKTMQWFAKVVRDHAGPGAIDDLTDSDGLPLMSDEKSFQLAAIREEPSATRIWVASWNPAEADF